jgi:hypothetical protein
VPGKCLGLGRLAVAEGVQAELAQDQRLVADLVLQAQQVAPEGGLVLQVDVEGVEVNEGVGVQNSVEGKLA